MPKEEKIDQTFDTMPDRYGESLDKLFNGLDSDVLKELIKFIRTELNNFSKEEDKTPNMAEVLRMMGIFFSRLEQDKKLKEFSVGNYAKRLVFKALDAVIRNSDKAFATEYPIQFKNVTETHDAESAAKLLVQIVAVSAYAEKQQDKSLSGKARVVLLKKYDSSLIADLIMRKKELKESDGWTLADEHNLNAQEGERVDGLVGEKVLRVFIKPNSSEGDELYEQVAVDKRVRKDAERTTACPECGHTSSKNPYRLTCEACGGVYAQETHTRVVSERLIKRAINLLNEEAVVIPEIIDTPKAERQVEAKSGTDYEIADANDVSITEGPYRNITVRNCNDIDFKHTRVKGNINLKSVNDLSGDLTISSDSNVTVKGGNDFQIRIVRVTDGSTKVDGSITLNKVNDIELTGTHNNIEVNGAGDIHFDNVVVCGSVRIGSASDISGEITLVGGGQLLTTDCGELEVKINHK